MSVDDAYEVLNLPRGQGQWVDSGFLMSHKMLGTFHKKEFQFAFSFVCISAGTMRVKSGKHTSDWLRSTILTRTQTAGWVFKNPVVKVHHMKTLNSFVSNSLFCQDIFEKVNKAYEFLCTKSARIIDGPDPENIILILKAQSILFNRHRQGVKIDPDLFLVHFFKILFNLLTCALSRDRTGALQIRWLSHAHQNN